MTGIQRYKDKYSFDGFLRRRHLQKAIQGLPETQDIVFSEGASAVFRPTNGSDSYVPNPVETGGGDMDVILDVVFIFLAGIAIIIALLVLLYATVVLMDRYCCCSCCFGCMDDDYVDEDEYEQDDSEHNFDEAVPSAPSARLYGPVAFKARLWGLNPLERTAIIEKIFSKNCGIYDSSANINMEKKERKRKQNPKQRKQLKLDEHSGMGGESPVAVAPSTCHDSSQAGSDVDVDVECMIMLPPNDKFSDKPFAADHEACSSYSDEDSFAKVMRAFQRNCQQTGRVMMHSISSRLSSISSSGVGDSTESGVSSTVLDEDKLETTCSICLTEYEDGDKILKATTCSHQFHHECLMPWLVKCNDYCPYCRELMMTPHEMRKAAIQVLTLDRVKELTKLKSSDRSNNGQNIANNAERNAAAVAAESVPELSASPIISVSTAVDAPGDISTSTAAETRGTTTSDAAASPASSDQAQLGRRRSFLSNLVGRNLAAPAEAAQPSRYAMHTLAVSDTGGDDEDNLVPHSVDSESSIVSHAEV